VPSKKRGFCVPPQPHGVAEDEVVEIGLGDEAVLDQLERLGQADAALEEREAQIGEAPGHAAEEQRLGDVVAGRGEVTDVVEGAYSFRSSEGRDSNVSVISARRLRLMTSESGRTGTGHS
jgi:hypothetical protein